MQTLKMGRVTANAAVAIIGGHSRVGLVKFATALLMCSCDSSSQMVCGIAFSSSVVTQYCHMTPDLLQMFQVKGQGHSVT